MKTMTIMTLGPKDCNDDDNYDDDDNDYESNGDYGRR